MAIGWHMQQRGPRYRSNNAGDGPEKTRDRRFWFPRFKSTLLGSYRSKATFVLCECGLAQLSPEQTLGPRSKTTNGHHCACGRDEWHLAKKVEETEYNIRLEVSKHYGGVRYEEALAQHTMDLEKYMANTLSTLPCSLMAGGCPICADEDRRACGGRMSDLSLNGEEFIDLAPLPLRMDDNAVLWKDPTFVHEYLGCFLDGEPPIKDEFHRRDGIVDCKLETSGYYTH